MGYSVRQVLDYLIELLPSEPFVAVSNSRSEHLIVRDTLHLPLEAFEESIDSRERVGLESIQISPVQDVLSITADQLVGEAIDLRLVSAPVAVLELTVSGLLGHILQFLHILRKFKND